MLVVVYAAKLLSYGVMNGIRITEKGNTNTVRRRLYVAEAVHRNCANHSLGFHNCAI